MKTSNLKIWEFTVSIRAETAVAVMYSDAQPQCKLYIGNHAHFIPQHISQLLDMLEASLIPVWKHFTLTSCIRVQSEYFFSQKLPNLSIKGSLPLRPSSAKNAFIKKGNNFRISHCRGKYENILEASDLHQLHQG